MTGTSVGGGTGTRTPNPLLAKQVRYQLRHAPEWNPVRLVRRAWVPCYAMSSVALLQTLLLFSESCHRLNTRRLAAAAAAMSNFFTFVSLQFPEMVDPWAYQDLNLGPLRYQRSALTA